MQPTHGCATHTRHCGPQVLLAMFVCFLLGRLDIARLAAQVP
jgi:hypothetical protein